MFLEVPAPEVVADPGCVLAESPLWHPYDRVLYWIDIPSGRLFGFNPATRTYRQVIRTELIGGLTLLGDRGLLLMLNEGYVAAFEAGRLRRSRLLRRRQSGYRFNDAIADPRGRVFAGTMAHVRPARTLVQRIKRRCARMLGKRPKRPGHLYRFDTDGDVSVVLPNVGQPNGMGFSPDRRTFYATDTAARVVYAFDYCERSGDIDNRRTVLKVPAEVGRPDGLTVDAEGYLWMALSGGGCVVGWSPEGREVGRIAFPASRLTSVAFGGPDQRDLYVTSAGGDRRDLHGRAAGALFRVRMPVPGAPDYAARIPC